jgi:hypothetical protein
MAAPLVPCEGATCQTCDLIKLGNNIVEWLVKIMATVCAIVVAVAGFKMVTAGGDSGAISEAREMITNVVVGFIMLLSAWLVIDTVMKMFLSDTVTQFGPWHQIECVFQPEGGAKTPTGTTTPPIVAVPGVCATQCTTIPSSIEVKATACSGPCTVSSEIVNQLTALDSSLDAAGVSWRITEAFPPTVQHSNPCHSNGTCVDAALTGSNSLANIKTFMDSSKTAGLRPVYEGVDCGVRDTLRSQGYSAYCKSDSGYGHITGTHFSVYK